MILENGQRGDDFELRGAGRVAPATPCFSTSTRHEIVRAGRKFVGSAQRRQGTSFLQHGAVLLGVDAPRLLEIFPTTRDPLAPLTTVETALGRRPSFDEVARALTEAFEAEYGLDLRPGGLTKAETARVAALVDERYATDAWLAGAPA
jgi:lipoate-protein ligase A